MSENLTEAQKRVYDYIVKFYKREGFYPSTREIALGLGFVSTNTVASHIAAIERRGWIERIPNKSRGFKLYKRDQAGNKKFYIPRKITPKDSSGLPKRQRQLFEFIVGYMRKTGVAPSYSEAAVAMGVCSSGYIAVMCNSLIKKGFLKRDSRARTLVIVNKKKNVIGKEKSSTKA